MRFLIVSFQKTQTMKKFAVALFLTICSAQSHADQGTPSNFGEIIRQYLMEHPEVISEAQAKLQQRTQEAQEKAQREAIEKMPNLTSSPVLGKSDAVVVTWFFDYRCGYCKQVEPAMEDLLKQSNVKVVFKELAILGDQSVLAAKAALAANKQGKFSEMHEWLYGNADSDLKSMLAFAESAGMSKSQLEKDMNDQATNTELAEVRDLAQKLGINGTPAFVIGNKLIPGAVELKVLQEAVLQAKVLKK
jgi:protein-disulfide isomerase